MIEVLFGSNSEAGLVRIDGERLFTTENGHGWTAAGRRLARQRRTGNRETDGLLVGREPSTYAFNLPPGRYICRIVTGDTDYDNHVTRIACAIAGVETAAIRPARGEYREIRFSADLETGPLTIAFDSPVDNWAVSYIEVRLSAEAVPLSISRRMLFESQWRLPPVTASGPDAMIARFLAATADETIDSTRVSRIHYLSAVSGILGFFLQHQADSGAIIDPFRNLEVQYATPAFAYSAALIANNGQERFLDPARRALAHSVEALATRSAASGHEDFFPFMIAHAMRLMRSRLPVSTYEELAGKLAKVDPFSTYKHRLGGRDGPGSNWNCKALSGEFLLYKLGIRDSLDFVEASLARQGRFFDNEFGLYTEGPTVYDIFPRSWLEHVVLGGYEGVGAEDLRETLRRGALTSLFMQMPDGSLVSGGRSAHHLWGDALEALNFEIAAGRYNRAGIRDLAGVFKRGAHRAYAGIAQWQQMTGEFPVVRNRTLPSERHGYEGYSTRSQYNLLCALILGLAFEHAEGSEEVVERVSPAEKGNYILELPRPFSRIIANVAGTAVSVAMTPVPGQFSAGLSAAQFLGLPGLLGVNDGMLNQPAYRLPGEMRQALVTGLCWEENAEPRNLAQYAPGELTVACLDRREKVGLVEFTIDYHAANGTSLVHEQYMVRSGRIEVDYSRSAVLRRGPCNIALPLLVSDGQNEVAVECSGDSVIVSLGGKAVRYTVPDSGGMRVGDVRYGHRNGWAVVASAPASTSRLIMEAL